MQIVNLWQKGVFQLIVTSKGKDNRYTYGATFNGVHSSEYGLDVLADKEIGLPDKTKITVDIPYSNNIIDLSDLYGSQAYGERELKYPFHVMDRQDMQKERLYVLWQKAVNWLMAPSHKVGLVDDVDPHWHYLVEVQKAPSWEEFKSAHGTLEVTFTACPFRIKNDYEGNDIWDTFNFDTDIAQFVDFDIVGSKDVVLYNIGLNGIIPTIISDSNMTLISGDTEIDVVTGENTFDWNLGVGVTAIKIVGTGHISFRFYREEI